MLSSSSSSSSSGGGGGGGGSSSSSGGSRRSQQRHLLVDDLDGEHGLGGAVAAEGPLRRLVRHPRLDRPLRTSHSDAGSAAEQWWQLPGFIVPFVVPASVDNMKMCRLMLQVWCRYVS